jgi:hypothetical protein
MILSRGMANYLGNWERGTETGGRLGPRRSGAAPPARWLLLQDLVTTPAPTVRPPSRMAKELLVHGDGMMSSMVISRCRPHDHLGPSGSSTSPSRRGAK